LHIKSNGLKSDQSFVFQKTDMFELFMDFFKREITFLGELCNNTV